MAGEFDAILNDPDYQALDDTGKFQFRKAFFQQKIAQDPDYQALSDVDRQKFTKKILFPEAEKEEPTKGQKLVSGKLGDAIEFTGRALSRLAPFPDVIDAVQGKRPKNIEAFANPLPRAATDVIEGGLGLIRRNLGHDAVKLVEDALLALGPVEGEFARPGRLRALSRETVPLKPEPIPEAPKRVLEDRPAPRQFTTLNDILSDQGLDLNSFYDALKQERADRQAQPLGLTRAQERSSSLLDEAQRQTLPDAGNTTLSAAQDAILGRRSVPEPSEAVRALQAEQEQIRSGSIPPKIVSDEARIVADQPRIVSKAADDGAVGVAKAAESVGDDIVTAARNTDFSQAGIVDLVKEGFKGELGAVGSLSPAEAAAEARARAARREILRRVSDKAAKENTTLTAAGKALGIAENVISRTVREQRFEDVGKRVDTVIADFEGLNNSAKTIFENAETIRNTGTLPKELREGFRETGPKPETFGLRISEEDTVLNRAKAIATAREISKIQNELDVLRSEGDLKDPVTKSILDNLQNNIETAKSTLNDLAGEQRKQKFAAGRTVRSYSQPIPEDVITAFRDAGFILPKIGPIKDKVIGWRNLVEKVYSGELRGAEAAREAVDVVKLNLFSTASFVWDIFSNTTELGGQVTGGLARDVVTATKGDASFPSMRGVVESIRTKAKIPAQVAEEVGLTAFGESVNTAFRTKPATSALDAALNIPDQLSRIPLAAKTKIDTAAKRLSAAMHLWRDAFEEVNKRGLSGLERQKFLDEFMLNPPEAALETAIREGRKAGFNRPLTAFERRVAGSKAYQLLGEAFASWSFQFTRHAVEMLGVYNPELFNKVLSDSKKLGPSAAFAKHSQDIGNYLGKTATGLGAVYLVNNVIYDNVDWNTMEYVTEDKQRIRLRGFDMVQVPLILAATIRGDTEKAQAAYLNSNLPAAGLIANFAPRARGGGLLGSTLKALASSFENGDVDPKGLKREFQDTLNRMLPGQAVLTTLKSILDPVEREGLGRNVPGVSFLKEPQINLATGEPRTNTQRIPFTNLETRNVSGVAIPGATRVLDPVEKVFATFDRLVKRPNRAPIAGFNPKDVPQEVTREYEQALGKARQRIIRPFAERVLEQVKNNPELLKDRKTFDRLSATLGALDNQAARIARNETSQKFGNTSRPGKALPVRTKRAPVSQRPEN